MNWLRVFEAAARTGSFARAAAELNLSPSAVSQQIRALEGHFGVQLFDRNAQSIVLNRVGQMYLLPVRQSLLTIESSTKAIFGQDRHKTIFIHSVLLFAHGILAPKLNGFRTNNPEIVLNLSTTADIKDQYVGHFDLEIHFGNEAAVHQNRDHLIDERLYPVALSHTAECITRPEDLLDHVLIAVATHRAGWPQYLGEFGIAAVPPNMVTVDNTLMAFALAESGAGVALARAPASDRTLAVSGLVNCLPLFPAPGIESYWLSYPNLADLSPIAREFRRWLLSEMRSLHSDQRISDAV